MIGREHPDRERLDLVERHSLVVVRRPAVSALTPALKWPGRIDPDDSGAVAGSDQGMQVGNAAALCGLCAALFTFLGDLDLADGPPINPRY